MQRGCQPGNCRCPHAHGALPLAGMRTPLWCAGVWRGVIDRVRGIYNGHGLGFACTLSGADAAPGGTAAGGAGWGLRRQQTRYVRRASPRSLRVERIYGPARIDRTQAFRAGTRMMPGGAPDRPRRNRRGAHFSNSENTSCIPPPEAPGNIAWSAISRTRNACCVPPERVSEHDRTCVLDIRHSPTATTVTCRSKPAICGVAKTVHEYERFHHRLFYVMRGS